MTTAFKGHFTEEGGAQLLPTDVPVDGLVANIHDHHKNSRKNMLRRTSIAMVLLVWIAILIILLQHCQVSRRTALQGTNGGVYRRLGDEVQEETSSAPSTLIASMTLPLQLLSEDFCDQLLDTGSGGKVTRLSDGTYQSLINTKGENNGDSGGSLEAVETAGVGSNPAEPDPLYPFIDPIHVEPSQLNQYLFDMVTLPLVDENHPTGSPPQTRFELFDTQAGGVGQPERHRVTFSQYLSAVEAEVSPAAPTSIILNAATQYGELLILFHKQNKPHPASHLDHHNYARTSPSPTGVHATQTLEKHSPLSHHDYALSLESSTSMQAIHGLEKYSFQDLGHETTSGTSGSLTAIAGGPVPSGELQAAGSAGVQQLVPPRTLPCTDDSCRPPHEAPSIFVKQMTNVPKLTDIPNMKSWSISRWELSRESVGGGPSVMMLSERIESALSKPEISASEVAYVLFYAKIMLGKLRILTPRLVTPSIRRARDTAKCFGTLLRGVHVLHRVAHIFEAVVRPQTWWITLFEVLEVEKISRLSRSLPRSLHFAYVQDCVRLLLEYRKFVEHPYRDFIRVMRVYNKRYRKT